MMTVLFVFIEILSIIILNLRKFTIIGEDKLIDSLLNYTFLSNPKAAILLFHAT